ncbi:MAG: hypothetical protein ACOYLH_03805 [Flavobacteriales bacterium]
MVQFRKIENLHILLWLLKDICWINEIKVLGTFMVIPTLSVAIWLTWKSKEDKVELIHNSAVTLWILANSTWMLGEFFWHDKTKPLAVTFFVLGIGILLIYYIGKLLKTKV